MIKYLLIIPLLIILYALIILLFGISFNTKNADYIILLGHKLINNQPSEVLKYRIKTTLRYLKSNDKCKIVLSGGITSNNTVSEAEIMMKMLLENNVDKNRIILEDKSIDTVENFINCYKYIPHNNKIVIISSNYHLLRSKMISRLLGVKTKAIGSYTPIKDLIIHLGIEEVYLIKHYIRIKKMTT